MGTLAKYDDKAGQIWSPASFMQFESYFLVQAN